VPKNAYILEKSCKTAAGLRSLRTPPPDPCVVTPAYWYSLTSAFLALNILYSFGKKNRSNKQQNNFVLLWLNFSALLRLFFISNSAVFVDGGSKVFFAGD